MFPLSETISPSHDSMGRGDGAIALKEDPRDGVQSLWLQQTELFTFSLSPEFRREKGSLGGGEGWGGEVKGEGRGRSKRGGERRGEEREPS